MIDLTQLRLLVVRPTLQHLAQAGVPYTLAAENLIIGTAMWESQGFRYLAQVDGPALGFWQMEPATFDDLWNNFISGRSALRATMIEIAGGSLPPAQALVANLALGCAMARLQYYRSPRPIVEGMDAQAMAALYKAVYNTPRGAADIARVIGSFQAAQVST